MPDRSPGARSPRSLLPDPAREGLPHRRWSSAELAILREYYPTEGLDGCLARLPRRSAAAIYCQAAKRGVQAAPDSTGRRGGRPRVWASSPSIDAAIRQCYENPGARKVRELAAELGRPAWWVKKRALKLGLVVPRFRQPEWTSEEDQVLERLAGMSVEAVQRAVLKVSGVRRSPSAINMRRKRLRLGMRDRDDNLSAAQVAGLLGVDTKVITRWIHLGLLAHRRRQTERTATQGGDPYVIKRSAIRRFCATHPHQVARHLRKVDALWFIDLLVNP